MNDRLRHTGRRVISRLSTATAGRAGEALGRDREVAALRRRVAELESEMQESRRLNRRLAELTDVVQELLLPVAQRDEEKLRERLDRYSSSL